jgi:hypothetical protein
MYKYTSDSNVVALVWSLTNQWKEMPYTISRNGKNKKDGGSGVEWKCTCPSFIHRGQKTCKHLSLLKSGAKDGSILFDNRFNITDFGLEILKLKSN